MENIQTAFAQIGPNYPLVRAYVFGSRARGDARDDSDFDVMLDMDAGFSLFDLCGITNELQDSLGVPCDVATRKSLKSHVRENAEREAVCVYERP